MKPLGRWGGNPQGDNLQKSSTIFKMVVILGLGGSMVKRIVDILEKFGVGSLLVGLYQQKWLAVLLGCAALFGCLFLNRRLL